MMMCIAFALLLLTPFPSQAENFRDRLASLEYALGPEQRVIRFSQAEAGSKIGGLHELATNFVSGVRNRGLIHLDPRDDAYLKDLFKVAYRLVGRFMGSIFQPLDRSLAVQVRDKYFMDSSVGFGPRFSGVAVNERGEIYVVLEYLQGRQLTHYRGDSVSRGIVEAIDRGVIQMVEKFGLLVMDAPPNNLAVQKLENHPRGFKYGA